MLAAQLVLVGVFGPFAIIIGLTVLVALFAYRPLAGLTVYFQVLIYQNSFLSLFLRTGIEKGAFTAVQGFAFAAISGMALVSVWRVYRPAMRHTLVFKLTRCTIIALAVIVAYACYGVVRSSPTSAVIYFRSDAAMLLALIVGLDVGRNWCYRTVGIIFISSFGTAALLAVVEYVAPYTYYTFFDLRGYYNFKLPVDVPEISRSVNQVIASRVMTWFNITGGGNGLSVRLYGPNIEMVSFAYVVAVVGVVAATLGQGILALAVLLFLVSAGVKGPLIMLVLAGALFAICWVIRDWRLALAASLFLLASYVTVGIVHGMASRDFHVIGLLGGVNGFLNMPWGHGLGVGGNLSEEALQGGLDWQTWQHTGADYALESSVGVLLYQMGVAAAAVYVPIIMLLRRGMAQTTWQRVRRHPSAIDVLFIAIACILVNGFFQEEAYSPYALGILTLLGGVAVSCRSGRNLVAVQA